MGDEPQDVVFAGTTDGSGFFKRGFITAAHRGQNHTRGSGHSDPEGQFASAGVGRADVWVFDATSLGSGLGGDPIAVIGLFGDKPRALATNAAGTSVYAAVFHSGNRTTTLSEGLVCNTSAANITNGIVQPACTNAASEPGAGGIPLPHKNQAPDSKTRPETGLIVQFNRNGATSNHWLDELGRNWDASVRFSLPDRDVFEIDADASTPAAVDPLATCANGAGCWAGVGTTLFNMVVSPSGKIYVSNTDAKNQTRFEGPGIVASAVKPVGEPPTVQGNLAQSRITVLDGSNVNVRHLNKHLNYSILKAPAADKAKSLATPTAMAISGTTLYVAAFGSQTIGVFNTAQIEANTFTPDASTHINLSGGGPAGLVVRGSRLYVLTRFDDSIAVVDPATKLEVQKIAMHTPEPADVITGRPFLYDAQLTSSNGEASCSSCHIFGDMDDLAWDLGNPDDNQVANGNPFNPLVPVGPPPADNLPHVFHPMKGPMTTQSLRGLVFQGPEHWRGDRQSNGAPLNETDSTLAFEAFNVAFDGLVGHAGQLPAADMTKFRKFAMALAYPPNPMRQLNNTLRAGSETNGATDFSSIVTDVVTSCNGCHVLNPANGVLRQRRTDHLRGRDPAHEGPAPAQPVPEGRHVRHREPRDLRRTVHEPGQPDSRLRLPARRLGRHGLPLPQRGALQSDSPAADRCRGLHDGLRVGPGARRRPAGHLHERERRRGGAARRLRSRRRPRRTSPRSSWGASSRSAISSPRWWRAASSAAISSTPPRCSSSPIMAAPASATRRCATRR